MLHSSYTLPKISGRGLWPPENVGSVAQSNAIAAGWLALHGLLLFADIRCTEVKGN